MRFTGPASQVKKCPLDEGAFTVHHSPFTGAVDRSFDTVASNLYSGLPQGACLVFAGEAVVMGKELKPEGQPNQEWSGRNTQSGRFLDVFLILRDQLLAERPIYG
jgi:hypothetical protein